MCSHWKFLTWVTYHMGFPHLWKVMLTPEATDEIAVAVIIRSSLGLTIQGYTYMNGSETGCEWVTYHQIS